MNVCLTCDDDKCCETGKGGHIQIHTMEVLREIHDGVYPVPKTADALHAMEHRAVAEDQLTLLGT